MMATMARIVALESRPAAQRLTGKFIVGDKVRAATGNMAGRELIVAEVTPATSPPAAPPAWQTALRRLRWLAPRIAVRV